MSGTVQHGNIPARSFKRLFPNLNPLLATPEELRTLVLLMRDDVKPRLTAADERNYAGLTYLGQFIDHDLSRERITQLGGGPVDINNIVNGLTSWFDLDSVYGENNQFLNLSGLFDFSVNSVGEEDLLRNPDGTAIIGDSRNDENLITAGIHFVFLKFHNRVFMDLKNNNQNMRLPQLISESKKIVQWHYQYIVVTQFLKDITGKYYSRLFNTTTNQPIIHPAISALGGSLPIEFSGAVYRFGHSLVRDGYYINDKFDLFPLFDPVIPSLVGFKPRPIKQVIDWSMFFPFPFTKGFQEWEGIDAIIVNSLFQLPIPVAVGEPILPLRSMIRGTIYGLPSGQDLARAFGIPENEILSLTNGNLVFQSLNGIAPQPDLDLLNNKFGESTPLFYYILMEAWVYGNGESLGPLGSLIVGGVFLNLLTLNQESYLNNGFSPVQGLFGCVKNNEYYMTELITYALNLKPFLPNTIIPEPKTNFFDQHSVNQFSIALGQVHPLQITIQPDLIPEVPVEPYPGLQIDAFDPTLILGTATQQEINIVATNALRNGLNSVYAVFKFVANKNIQAIANNIVLPFAKKISKPIVQSTFIIEPTINQPITINASQLRGRALNKTINESLRYTVDEALAVLTLIEEQINQALNNIPPVIIIEDFINGDILL
jgi:hypothetical protein